MYYVPEVHNAHPTCRLNHWTFELSYYCGVYCEVSGHANNSQIHNLALRMHICHQYFISALDSEAYRTVAIVAPCHSNKWMAVEAQCVTTSTLPLRVLSMTHPHLCHTSTVLTTRATKWLITLINRLYISDSYIWIQYCTWLGVLT